MSTFDGVVNEFPSIRIDNFRVSPGNARPLACFLSHVHSDHLKGLESLKAPFVYCSTATREILLRIEKSAHRMNFDQGLLEAKIKQYKHLAKLLRPIPLEVPTEIELSPISRIRVTLFDANHCPGSVMFLFEGDGKSILYTGDVRAEHWWVNMLNRHPVLLPYFMGEKHLHTIYLDTSFIRHKDIYQRYPSKADGMRHLLNSIKRYPEDTIFYFRAWTLGYEEVWQALASALRTQVHVDRHKHELFTPGTSRAQGNNNGSDWPESTFLCGFTLGHSHVEGCLTRNKFVRIHSCEPPCSRVSAGPTVYIAPVVNPTQSTPSASGHEVAMAREEDAFQDQLLQSNDDDSGMESQSYEIPQVIRFPYSRHSSYEELCDLVAVLKPKDIVPCTIDLATWRDQTSIKSLFGHLCSGREYAHDNLMKKRLGIIDGIIDEDVTEKFSQVSSKHNETENQSSIMPSASSNDDQFSSSQYQEFNVQPADSIEQTHEAFHLSINPPCARSPNSPSSPTRLPTGQAQVADSLRSLNSHGSQGIADIRELLRQQEGRNQLQFSITPALSSPEGPTEPLPVAASSNQAHNVIKNYIFPHVVDPPNDSPDPDDISDCDIIISLASDIAPSSENPEIFVSGAAQRDAAMDLKTRLQAYHAVQTGSFQSWSSMYGQSNYHEEEIEL